MKKKLSRLFYSKEKDYWMKLLFLCFSLLMTLSISAQQQISLSGNVKDTSGEPIIGASVKVVGSTIGTITDLDGNFVLQVPSQSTIEVTYMGYLSQTIPVNGRRSISVALEEDTKSLDEVVVIGYGTVKKRDLTGAVSSVKSEDIVLNPGSNPMEALQGKVAGLDITRESGQAGSGIKMQVRGNRSIKMDEKENALESDNYKSSNPLFIIDGMPGDYATLNPNDIESIEVLKDASSTAVYGSDGANGIVIITTKSGKAGKAKVDFNAYFGVNGWATLPTMRSGDSYLQGLRDAYKATGNWNSTADDEKLFSSAAAYQAHLAGKYLNWPDLLLQNNLTQNYSVAVSGGTEKTKAYFSLNFSDEEGQLEGDNYKVYSTNVRVDHSIQKWIRTGVNVQGSYVHRNRAYGKLINMLRAVPLGEAYDENGNINKNPVVGDDSMISLLLNNQSGVYKDQNQNLKLYVNPYLEITPMNGLTFTTRLGGALQYSRNNYFQGQGSYQYYNTSGSSATGTNSSVYAQVTDKRDYDYKWENILSYNFDINKDHNFTVTGVTSWEHKRYDFTRLYQDNIADNKYLWHNIDTSNGRGWTSYEMRKKMAFIGRVNYSYKGKYLFAASVRHEGDSRLADGNKWHTFPAVSGAWRISDESFMEASRTWLDDLKIRLGYGITGTAKIAPYTSNANLLNGNYTIGGESVQTNYFSQNYANSNLTWEKSHNTNLGFDLTVLNGRVNLATDLYLTNTDGVILKREIPVVNGAYNASTKYYTNVNLCETRNTGLEIALNTRNIATSDFKWNSSVTFAWNKEKITKLTQGATERIVNGDYALVKGHAVYSYYQYKKTGIWQKGEAADAAVFNMAPGDIKIDVPGMHKESDGKWYRIDEKTGNKTYYDASNTYAIGDEDKQIIGKNSPDWTLGFKNTFIYKDFDLSIFTYARWGQMVDYDLLGFYDPTGEGNFPTYFNYWTEDNPSNDFPAANSSRAITNYTASSSLNYVDGSFFKIKNITLGYTLPSDIARKAGMERCRIYGTITNPYIYAKSHLLKDYDPEMNGELNYPSTRQLVFGVNVTF